MAIIQLTCISCPLGCPLKVETDEKGTALNNHIVSYSKDKNNVYSLTDRSDVAIADAKGENLEIQNGVASMMATLTTSLVPSTNTSVMTPLPVSFSSPVSLYTKSASSSALLRARSPLP